MFVADNRRKKPRQRQKALEYNVFEQKQEQEHGPRISQQVAFAAYQFLSTGGWLTFLACSSESGLNVGHLEHKKSLS